MTQNNNKISNNDDNSVFYPLIVFIIIFQIVGIFAFFNSLEASEAKPLLEHNTLRVDNDLNSSAPSIDGAEETIAKEVVFVEPRE